MPFVDLYYKESDHPAGSSESNSNSRHVLLNRELVNSGHAVWSEYYGANPAFFPAAAAVAVDETAAVGGEEISAAV